MPKLTKNVFLAGLLDTPVRIVSPALASVINYVSFSLQLNIKRGALPFFIGNHLIPPLTSPSNLRKFKIKGVVVVSYIKSLCRTLNLRGELT